MTPTNTLTPTPTATPGLRPTFGGLTEWWISDTGVSTNSSLGVTGWTGLNGSTLTASTITRLAQYNSSDSNFNNKPSILINSGATNLDWGYSTPMLSGSTDKTWLMVSRLVEKTTGQNYNTFFFAGPGIEPRAGIFGWIPAPDNRYNCFSNPPSTETLTGSTFVNNTYQFMRLSYTRSTGNYNYYVSSGNTFQSLLTTNNGTTNQNFTGGTLCLGGFNSTVGSIISPKMNVVEFLQINGIPTSQELTNYSNYLNFKYNI